MSNPEANRYLPNTDQDAKYREVKEKIAALIRDNKVLAAENNTIRRSRAKGQEREDELAAEVRELRQDRDYRRNIAQIGGRG